MLSLQTQQVLLPKKVYIGDSAELRVTFSSTAAFTLTEPASLKKKIAETEENTEESTEAAEVTENVSSNYFLTTQNQKDYVINDVQLSRAGVDYYQLSIYFVPWKTGNITLPSYVLVSEDQQEYLINFEQINVVSLLERNDQGTYSTTLQSSTGPLLLPGTIYKLWTIIIVLLILLIILIRLIVKHKQVSFYIKNQKLLLKYRRNARRTVRKLNELLDMAKNPDKLKKGRVLLSDPEYAAEIQKIMRNYLEVRFEYPFSKSVSSQIMENFNKATSYLASDNKLEAAGAIAGTFTRTDYIRYSKDGVFLQNEKIEIIDSLKKNIQKLEAVEMDIPEADEPAAEKNIIQEN